MFVKVLSTIYVAFKALPDLIRLVNYFVELWRDYADRKARRELQKKTVEAIRKAVKEKDTSDLEGLFGGNS